VFQPNENTVPPPASPEEEGIPDANIDHEHAVSNGENVKVIVNPVTPQPYQEEVPIVKPINMPPPILPDNMVQECDSQTGRCWFTTKPEVIPVISTAGSLITLEPEPNALNNDPTTKPDTQGWSSGTSGTA
jgi:hypothetical protein